MKTTPSARVQRFLLLRPAFHVAVIVFVYRLVVLLRGYTDLIPFVQLKIPVIDLFETILFALLSAIIFLGIGFAYHLYGLFRPTKEGYGTFFQTRLLRVIMSGFVARIGFGYVFTSGISRFVVVVASAGALFGLLLVDVLRSRGGRLLGKTFVYRLLIIGADTNKSDRILAELVDHEAYQCVTVAVSQVARYEAHRDGCVIVGSVDESWLTAWHESCRLAGKDVYQLAEGHFFEDSFGVPMTLGPLVVTARRSSPLTERRRVVKRGGDIVVSFIGLLVLSPVFLCVALAIQLDSPGPIFYRQPRVGKQKRLFSFVKFRSMYTHLSTGPAYGGAQAEHLYEQLIHSDQNIRVGILPKIANDPRVTRVGKRLRKTSLDELPSLRSVFVGDMSLVGPRPHLPREVDQYASWHQRLFSVKPGITGYAQLYGRDKVPFDEEAKLDLRYIQHRSMWLDLFVLFATFKVIFGGK